MCLEGSRSRLAPPPRGWVREGAGRQCAGPGGAPGGAPSSGLLSVSDSIPGGRQAATESPSARASPALTAVSDRVAVVEAAEDRMDGDAVHHHHHQHRDAEGNHAPVDGAEKLLGSGFTLPRLRMARKLVAAGPPTRHPHQHPMDALSRMTASFKTVLQRFIGAVEACQRSHYYSVLSRTTQPAHIVAFVSVALVAALLFPSSATQSRLQGGERSPWTSLTYIVSFAAHFGSQFWMTFVSGLSLFFSLPRHHFAEVQKVLFPLYFSINSALSLATLATYLRLQPDMGSWDGQVGAQVGTMVLCFLLELLVRLYLTPPLLDLITAKTEMEKTVEGVGQEVGRYDLGPLTQCPHYVKIHRQFRKVHASIAMANIMAMGCTAFHAQYLASKMCI